MCPTRALLGVDCPFCGGLRAAYSVLHGDLPAALRYNAFAFVLFGAVLWVVGARVRGARTGRPALYRAHLNRLLPVLYAAAVVWFIVRLLPFAPFSVLHI